MKIADEMLTLSLDNLEETYNMLKESHRQSKIFIDLFPLDKNIKNEPESRNKLNNLLNGVSAILKEISHVEAFLKNSQQIDPDLLSFEQKDLLEKCQTLSQSLINTSRKIISWTVEMKSMLNDSGCAIEADSSGDENDSDWDSKSPVEQYDEVRAILKDIHPDLIYIDPRERTDRCGSKLKLKKGNALLLETEHEMDVFMDYCLFQFRKDGKNIPQRYFERNSHLYQGRKLKILKALRDARFSLLTIKKPIKDYGLMVHDALMEKDFLMIDRGLSKTAHQKENYAVLTHYLEFPGFIMTTGASTPIPLETEDGKEMKKIFQDLVKRSKASPGDGICKQYITELYKIAFHRRLTLMVRSNSLPMTYGVAVDEQG